MRYQHPDLAEITTFLRDFGMSVAGKAEGKRWFKGYGTDQYVYYAQEGEKKFLGGTFEVESYAELEKFVMSAYFLLPVEVSIFMERKAPPNL